MVAIVFIKQRNVIDRFNIDTGHNANNTYNSCPRQAPVLIHLCVVRIRE